MGEALIVSRGGGGKGETIYASVVTNIITTNTEFVAPATAINNEFKVMIFGGGGYHAGYGGPGGGNMNKAILTLAPGTIVPITIGAGGYRNGSGNVYNAGTTSFGTYLSATGGESPTRNKGGNGGTGGGGLNGNGGIGYYGGGGGGSSGMCGWIYEWNGGSIRYDSARKNTGSGGNGGIYGGGGGSGGYIINYTDNNHSTLVNSNPGTITAGVSAGGWGNGGLYHTNGNVGANTLALEETFIGTGLAGITNNTSIIKYTNSTQRVNANFYTAGGGGGGYGGNGGNGGSWNAAGSSALYIYGGGGGGGGGYGANGGNGGVIAGGGGGGYGGKGGEDSNGGAGGGYGTSGYGAGGATRLSNGKNGVCIISWIEKQIL